MRVIDLLNKIANKEEIPYSIKFCNMVFEYDELSGMYAGKDGYLTHYINDTGDLMEKVEIIEEETFKKIEKLKYHTPSPNFCITDENNTEYKETIRQLILDRSWEIEDIKQRVNLLIDYINRENDNE